MTPRVRAARESARDRRRRAARARGVAHADADPLTALGRGRGRRAGAGRAELTQAAARRPRPGDGARGRRRVAHRRSPLLPPRLRQTARARRIEVLRHKPPVRARRAARRAGSGTRRGCPRSPASTATIAAQRRRAAQDDADALDEPAVREVHFVPRRRRARGLGERAEQQQRSWRARWRRARPRERARVPGRATRPRAL